MNRAQKLHESICLLLESDPFQELGYRIIKHTLISPKDKKFLLRKRKRVGDQVEKHLPGGEKKRIVSVYQHEQEHFGHIEHRSSTNYPLDSHFYELEKINDKQSKPNNK